MPIKRLLAIQAAFPASHLSQTSCGDRGNGTASAQLFPNSVRCRKTPSIEEAHPTRAARDARSSHRDTRDTDTGVYRSRRAAVTPDTQVSSGHAQQSAQRAARRRRSARRRGTAGAATDAGRPVDGALMPSGYLRSDGRRGRGRVSSVVVR